MSLNFGMFKNYLNFVFNEITSRRKRSFLTLLGIVIGVTLIVSLILLGQGLENAIGEQLSALGQDVLLISPKGEVLGPGLSTSTSKITERDLEIISGVNGVEKTAGYIVSVSRIEFNDQVRYLFIFSLPKDKEERELIGENNYFKIDKGRTFTKNDKFKAIVGAEYLKDSLFGKSVNVGDKILINDEEFKVVGIWEPIGTTQDDQTIAIPQESYWDVIGNEGELGLIMAKVSSGENLEVVKERVRKELRKYREVDEDNEDFQIETPLQLAESFATIVGVVNAILLGIATVSLIVGGVGITNTIYTSVLERTRQIGVLKSIGASRKQILFLFLLESAIYGVIGGMIGLFFGYLFAKLVEFAFALTIGPAFFSVRLTLGLVIGVILFSLVWSLLSGLAPAKKAADLNPAESLRYE